MFKHIKATITAPVIVISIVLFSTIGCTPRIQSEPSITEKLDKFIAKSKETQALSEQSAKMFPARNRAMAIPISASWLSDARTIHFRSGKAKDLIIALAAPHPVRFIVNDNPNVVAPATAVILKDYFDSIAAQSNWAYTVIDGVLVFRDWEVRSMFLAAMVGKTAAVLKTKTGADGSGQANELTTSTDPYADIESLISKILNVSAGQRTAPPQPLPVTQPFSELPADAGDVIVPGLDSQPSPQPIFFSQDQLGEPPDERVASFSVARSANMVVISAKPNQVHEVAAVIAEYNRSVSKRVVIDVTVYEVELTDGDNRSVNLNLLKAATNTLVSIGSADALTISRASSAAVAARNQLIIFNWIESQGTLSKRIHRRFETLNNHAVSFLDTEEIQYVKSISYSSDVGEVTTTPNIVIGAHQLGREFNLFATIIGDRVNIQITINDRRISGRERYSLGDAQGTLLNIFNNDKVIPLSLRSGETRVLTYFQSDNSETNHNRNKFLPKILGGKRDKIARSETVIVISASIVSGI